MIKVFKGTQKDNFEAYDKAAKWLDDNGFSYGSMCRNEPIGIMKGDYSIAKWKNLEKEHIGMLHGTIESTDYRNSDVIVTIKDEYTEGLI